MARHDVKSNMFGKTAQAISAKLSKENKLNDHMLLSMRASKQARIYKIILGLSLAIHVWELFWLLLHK